MARELELADGSRYALDDEGFLEDWTLWREAIAETMAAADGLELGDDHWRVIRLLRDWYGEHGEVPSMRQLVSLCRRRLGPEFGASRPLYRLFPRVPARQACRYAGLPKPVSCI